MNHKPKIVRGENISEVLLVQIATIITYVFVKFVMRPHFANLHSHGWLDIFLFSYPNFCEAIVGTISIMIFLILAKGIMLKKNWKPILSEKHLYLLAVVFAGIYVVLQEIKVHNLGGANIYDPYDVLFSCLGLVAVYFILIRFKPKIGLS